MSKNNKESFVDKFIVSIYLAAIIISILPAIMSPLAAPMAANKGHFAAGLLMVSFPASIVFYILAIKLGRQERKLFLIGLIGPLLIAIAFMLCS